MTVSTEQESVPVPPSASDQPPAPGARPRVWPWWAAAALMLALSAGVFAALTVNIGYYEFRPGEARATAPLVIAGDGVETYPPASDIGFTTVSLSRSTLVSYVLAWFDEDTEVLDEALVLGDRSPAENRQFNLQLMDTSKQDAIRLALVALGYDVPVTVDGNVIVEVQPGTAAEGSLDVGETIVAIDGEPIDDPTDVSRIMTGKGPGTVVHLDVEPLDRAGVETVELALGVNAEEPDRGLIGVRLQPRNPNYQFPFAIDIDSGQVGGPSAGLAFTLGVLDVLSPGELTGGYRVAVTGTIDGLGNVGPVGGVRQKTAVVVREHYDVFLVPSSEYAMAAERAGDTVRVIPVDTLQDALDALAALGGSGLGTPVDGG